MSEYWTLRIKTTNAAFEDDPTAEVTRILRDVADRFDECGVDARDGITVFDVNGNAVGRAGPAD